MDATELQPYLDQYKADLQRCESPIEKMMCSALYRSWFSVDIIHDIHFQQKISHGGREYRADFVVESQNTHNGKSVMLVVECDGHDFHEKTKTQAARDKRRDRDIQAAGYAVMRFTGSEIFRDSNVCAGEVISFLSAARSKA
jgi:very-short-patch-repair endonuclease